MNTKLQELTDKIYLEGVEKGNEQANAIVEKAQTEAAQIKAQAETQAQIIIAEAQAKATETEKNTKSELKLFAQQSINALKSEITNLLTGTIVSESVISATSDKAFMQKAILSLVEEWSKNQHITIETKDAESLTKFFTSQAKTLLSNGVKITQVNNLKTDFTITPEKEGYKIAIGEEEFTAYFKEFLRPKLIEMLF